MTGNASIDDVYAVSGDLEYDPGNDVDLSDVLNDLTFGDSPAQPAPVNDRIVLVSNAGRINILQSEPSAILPIAKSIDVKLFPNLYSDSSHNPIASL